MEKMNMKQVIYICINNILSRKQKKYAKLSEIYEEVSYYLEVENNTALKSQIRGRLQECCEQYPSFMGDALFITEKIRSGNWTIKTNDKKYIRYTNNNYLISDDNWLNLEMVRTIDSEYILEEDLDNVYRAKLMHLVGKNKANIIINELNSIRKLLKKIKNINKVNDGFGTAFEVFAISVIYNISYEECINKYIIHGDYDGKIDSIYYGESNNIYIYQIKIGDINDNAYNEMQLNYDKCLRNKIPENGTDLYNFIQKNESLLKNKTINFRSVSNNSSKKTNYRPIEIYNMFFKNKLLPLNNNNLALTILKPILSDQVSFQYNVSTDGNNNFNFYIKAESLIKHLLESIGVNPEDYDKDTIDISKYFSDNVRGVLSVNKKMIHTIENEPENFVKYNNGINITGEVTDLGNQIVIKNPIINNGQQTITTLIKTDKNLDKITVPVKITSESDMIIKGKISQFSNEQVKVKAIDMLSLNSYIRHIQSIILQQDYNGENYFLEIYSSGKKIYYDIIKKLYKEKNVIKLLDFIKLYFSVENSRELGLWKNSPNMQIEKCNINNYFDIDKSFKVCEAISRFENYLVKIENKKERDDFKSADLAFKYLICKEGLKDEEAALLITNINQKYYYKLKDEKSKLIDIYKSSTIIDKIESELELYRNKINK